MKTNNIVELFHEEEDYKTYIREETVIALTDYEVMAFIYEGETVRIWVSSIFLLYLYERIPRKNVNFGMYMYICLIHTYINK